MTLCPIHEDCEFSHCDTDMAAARAAITDLNQRLIDRTSGLLDLVQAQALEIATWKRRNRESVRCLMEALSPQVRALRFSYSPNLPISKP